jgi:hypothetical protein
LEEYTQFGDTGEIPMLDDKQRKRGLKGNPSE